MSAPLLSRRRVSQNTLSRAGGVTLAQSAKALAAVIVARDLGAEALGLFTFVLAAVTAIARCATLGVDTLLVRELNRTTPMLTPAAAMRIGCVAGAFLAGLCLVVPGLLGATPEVSRAFTAGSLYVLLTPPILVLGASFAGRERMDLAAAPLAAEGVVAVAAVVVAVEAGVSAALAALGLARLVNLLLSALLHVRLAPAPPAAGGGARQVLRESAPMWGSSVLSATAQRLDVLLLVALLSPAEVGLYVAASTVVLVAIEAGTHFTFALFPVLSRARDSADDNLHLLLQRVLRPTVLVLSAAAVALAAGGPLLIPLLYGPGFSQSVLLLTLLAALLPLRVVSSLLGLTLTATGRQQRRFALALAALALSVVLLPSAAAIAGPAGAAAAVVLVEVVVVGALRAAVHEPRSP